MSELFSPAGFLYPHMSVAAQAAFRASFGILVLATLIQVLPHWHRFFISERWGGYAKSSFDVDALQNPIVAGCIAAVWITCAVLLIAGSHPVLSSGIILLLSRYFFV